MSDEASSPKQGISPLEYLATVDGDEHSAASSANIIVVCATRLLNYQEEDVVIGAVLENYRVHIEQYLSRAAELVKEYQAYWEQLTAAGFFRSVPAPYRGYTTQFMAELIDLDVRAKEGKASVKNEFREKLRLQEKLEAMQEAQKPLKRELFEIRCIFMAMEKIVVAAKKYDNSAEWADKWLQWLIRKLTQYKIGEIFPIYDVVNFHMSPIW